MECFSLAPLIADSSLPLGKGIAMIMLFGGTGIFATFASFASKDQLNAWSVYIGTSNPKVARIVCIVAAMVCWGAVAVTIGSLSGMLDD